MEQLVIVTDVDDSQIKTPEGLTSTQASVLTTDLNQIISERKEMIIQYNEIIRMDITSPETQKMASDLRKIIVKNRTQGIEKWHELTKRYFLRGGQFVDEVKRKQIEVNKRMEESLSSIENYTANLEKQRRADLKQKRLEELGSLSQYLPQGVFIEDLDEAGFNHLKKMCASMEEEKKKEALEEQKKREQEEKDRRELARLRKIEEDKKKQELADKKAKADLAKKPEHEQIEEWVRSMTIPEAPVTGPIIDDIKLKFAAFKTWAIKQAQQQK